MSSKKKSAHPAHPKNPTHPSRNPINLAYILLPLAVVFLIIGIDQIIILGFANGYWAIMISLILLFVYNLRKRKK